MIYWSRTHRAAVAFPLIILFFIFACLLILAVLFPCTHLWLKKLKNPALIVNSKCAKSNKQGQVVQYISLLKSDSTLSKLRGWLLINHYTLMSLIDLKRGQHCTSLTMGYFIHWSGFKGAFVYGVIRDIWRMVMKKGQSGKIRKMPNM